MARKREMRGMTIAEIIISMGVLMLILSFITLFFRQAFTHMTLTSESMTNEHLARLAMAKINTSLSQASVDTAFADVNTGTPMPPVIAQTATSIAYFRVLNLVPPLNPLANGAPDPTYKVHIISYDPVGQTINEYVTDWATYSSLGPSPAPTLLATNVTNFNISQVTTGASGTEYQFQMTTNNILNPTQAEAPYSLVDNVDILFNT